MTPATGLPAAFLDWFSRFLGSRHIALDASLFFPHPHTVPECPSSPAAVSHAGHRALFPHTGAAEQQPFLPWLPGLPSTGRAPGLGQSCPPPWGLEPGGAEIQCRLSPAAPGESPGAGPKWQRPWPWSWHTILSASFGNVPTTGALLVLTQFPSLFPQFPLAHHVSDFNLPVCCYQETQTAILVCHYVYLHFFLQLSSKH